MNHEESDKFVDMLWRQQQKEKYGEIAAAKKLLKAWHQNLVRRYERNCEAFSNKTPIIIQHEDLHSCHGCSGYAGPYHPPLCASCKKLFDQVFGE